MKTRKSTYIPTFFFLIFFLYLFVVYDTEFTGPDEPIYFAYTASIVEDGDLNAVNHIDERYPYYRPPGKIGVSQTYNLPDQHNHGGVVLWAPFYIYGKMSYFMNRRLNIAGLDRYGKEGFIQGAMSFSSVLFGILTILLTFLFVRTFFSTKIAVWSVLAIFLGTPFFYYMLLEPGNGNMLASLFSILSILFCRYALDMKRSAWFWYGLFFSICVTVKVDLWFQIFFVTFVFTAFFISRKGGWANAAYFIAGLAPGLTLKGINDYLKYGLFHIGELGIYNLEGSYLFKMLFSSYRGFFYASPVFYICLAGFILVLARASRNSGILSKPGASAKEQRDEFFLALLSLYVFIKIMLISRDYAWGGGGLVSRTLLTEFPVFVLLYGYVLYRQRRSFARFLLAAISLVFIFWNLLVISEYAAGVDLNYAADTPDLSIRVESVRYIIRPLFSAKDLGLKSTAYFPLAVFGCGVIYLLLRFMRPVRDAFGAADRENNRRFFKACLLFTIYLFTAYTVVTWLNVANNKKNVEGLRNDGFFKNVELLAPEDYERMENVGSMDEMIRYFTLRGDLAAADRVKMQKERLLGKTGPF